MFHPVPTFPHPCALLPDCTQDSPLLNPSYTSKPKEVMGRAADGRRGEGASRVYGQGGWQCSHQGGQLPARQSTCSSPTVQLHWKTSEITAGAAHASDRQR